MEGGREGGRVWASLSLYYMVVNRGFMTRPAVINIHRHLVTRLVVRRIADVRYQREGADIGNVALILCPPRSSPARLYVYTGREVSGLTSEREA